MSLVKQEFIISDVVEMGHFSEIAGTISISLHFKEMQPQNIIKKCLSTIDTLDHCLVTDNKESTTYSNRFYLLDKSVSLYKDVVSIITNELLDVNSLDKITVKYDKFEYSSEPVLYVDILEQSTEG